METDEGLVRMSKETQTLKDEGYFTKMFLIVPVYHVTSCWCEVLGWGDLSGAGLLLLGTLWGYFFEAVNQVGSFPERQLSEVKYTEVNCHRTVFAVYDFIENWFI